MPYSRRTRLNLERHVLVVKALDAIARIEPLLQGLGPEVQGAVLADLTLTWLCGHEPRARQEVFALHAAAIWAEMPEKDRELGIWAEDGGRLH